MESNTIRGNVQIHEILCAVWKEDLYQSPQKIMCEYCEFEEKKFWNS